MTTATETLVQEVGTPAPTPDSITPPPIQAPNRRRRLAAVMAATLITVAIIIGRTWSTVFLTPPAQIVKASGRIEGREVTLAAKMIQGRITQLFADEGQTVAKGQVLAELDAAQIEAQVAAASAAVATLDAQLRQASLDVAYTAKNSDASIAAAGAALSSARSHVVRANAVVAHSAANFERATALFNERVLSKQELDGFELTLLTSRADLAATEKDVARAEADLALAHASADTIGLKRQQLRVLEESRRTAAARLDEARANLAERFITAPDNGTIVARPVEVGDVVNPGSPIFQIVDMTKLYLKVYIPEPDIPKLRLGGPAQISVDAFPGRTFEARVSKIYKEAEFTPKNVETADERLKLVFGVEVRFVNPDSVLKPGMPAECVIHWKPSESDGSRD
jgi:membrane fusion protein YbhG